MSRHFPFSRHYIEDGRMMAAATTTAATAAEAAGNGSSGGGGSTQRPRVFFDVDIGSIRGTAACGINGAFGGP